MFETTQRGAQPGATPSSCVACVARCRTPSVCRWPVSGSADSIGLGIEERLDRLSEQMDLCLAEAPDGGRVMDPDGEGMCCCIYFLPSGALGSSAREKEDFWADESSGGMLMCCVCGIPIKKRIDSYQ